MDDEKGKDIEDIRAATLFDRFDELISVMVKKRSRGEEKGDYLKMRSISKESIHKALESPIKYRMMDIRKIGIYKLTAIHFDRNEEIKTEKLRLVSAYNKVVEEFKTTYRQFKRTLDNRLDILFGCIRHCFRKILYSSSNLIKFKKTKEVYQLYIIKPPFDLNELESSLSAAEHILSIFSQIMNSHEIRTENTLILDERLKDKGLLRDLLRIDSKKLNENRFLQMMDFIIFKVFIWYKYFKFINTNLKVKERHLDLLKLFFERPEAYKDVFESEKVEFTFINSETKETKCGFEIIPDIYDEFKFIDYD